MKPINDKAPKIEESSKNGSTRKNEGLRQKDELQQNEELLNRLTEALRNTPPLPDEAEQLTAGIMEQIARTPRFRKSPWLTWVRWTSSAAAILLCSWYFLQQANSPEPASTTTYNVPAVHPSDTETTCYEAYTFQQGSLHESIYCHMMQNTLENRRFKALIRPESR